MTDQRAMRRPDPERCGLAEGPTPIGVLLVDVVARLRHTTAAPASAPVVIGEVESVAALAGSC